MVRLVTGAFPRWCTALALATAVLGSPLPAVAAGPETRPIEEAPAPVVEFRDGKLSVDARDADLAALLQEIAMRADFELTTTGQLGRRTAILTDVGLEEGLRRLVQGHELMLVYRPAESGRGTASLVAAHVFAERPGRPPLPTTAGTSGLSDIYQLVRAGNDPSNVAKLTDFLSRSPDATVRARAAWALGRIGAPSASAALFQAVNDQSPQVRSQVAYALRTLLGVQAVPMLVGLLQHDPDASVRLVAARNLGTLRDASATSALGAAASDADPTVRQEVTRALQRQGVALP